MPRRRDLYIIIGNLKGLFLIVTILMAAMVMICLISGTPQKATGFVYGLIISLAIALVIHYTVSEIETLELKHAIIIAALAYIIVPAVSAVPYIASANMAPIDALFEAVSGWTGSGYSMISSPEGLDRPIQLWRSLTQWLGGAGVILLMATILIRPGTSTYALYQSEARKDKIRPSIRSTINIIWKLYLLLTGIAIVLLYIAGMPAWDSLNIAMTAISTGGFSIYGNSIAHYDSQMIEFVLILIMIAGALPFATLYRTFRRNVRSLLQDAQVRVFAALTCIGCIVLTAQNYFFSYHNVYDSVRFSIFHLVSAITTTGLQTTGISDWSPTALLILSVAMIIGGCAGSTAGGIKIAREIFLANQIRLWLAKTLLSRKAVIVMNIGGRKMMEQAITSELNEATLISFLWVINIVISVMLLSNILGPDVNISNIIFEVCSAQGNVGISAGVITPYISPVAKVIFMVDMWMGRLEIVPVILLVRAILKGFSTY